MDWLSVPTANSATVPAAARAAAVTLRDGALLRTHNALAR